MLLQAEEQLENEALEYIIKNKNPLIKRFILDKKPLPIDYLTFFMAGSPGAGKTEFARRYIQLWWKKQFLKMKNDKELITLLQELGLDINDYERLFISIDVDEIREFIPQYQRTNIKNGTKGNAHVVQRASNQGLDILRNYCLKNNISFLHDGTFSNQYSTLKGLIKESLKFDREVQIFYIYMDPIIAWKYTQEREFLEGRNIKKESFVDQFFKSMNNVDRAKKDFGDNIEINCILKEEKKNIKKIKLNQPSVANFLKIEYNKGTLKKYSEDELRGIL